MKATRTKVLLSVLNHHQTRFTKMDVADARQYFEKISKPKDKPKLKSVTDHFAVFNGRKVKIRLYRNSDQMVPTIIYFHGGGWSLGSVNSLDRTARLICKATGFNVVSVDYRLAPEHPYPAAIEDGCLVMLWLKINNLDLDYENIILAGDSSGAQIALYVAINSPSSLAKNLKGLILIYPAVDPSLSTDSMNRYAKRHFVTKEAIAELWRLYLNNQTIDWPLSDSELAKLPSTLIQTAQYDILKDEGELLAKQLRESGVEVHYHNYKNATHGFMQVTSAFTNHNKVLRDLKVFSASVIH